MPHEKLSLRRIESWITEEHLEIRSMIDRLQTMTDPYVMLLVLRDLQDKLDQHFQNEEGEEGLYTIVNANAPQHAERVDRLIEEHHVLSRELHNLVKQCNQVLSGPLARLKTDMSRFIDQLQAHDIAETEILTDAVLPEIKPAVPPTKSKR